jgi:tetratricopeptide (TPR) repeat protein
VAGSDSNRKLQYAIGFCLFALTFATYSSVVHHEFVNYDDLRLIVNNPKLTRPAALPNLLSHFSAPETGNSNWLPLYWISLQLGFALHGPDPAAFLLTNVFIHAASAVFLFAVMLCLTLGLMSKSTLVTFPAVLLLLDVWPLDRLRGSTGRVLLEKAPMFGLVAVASIVTFLAQSATGNIALGARIDFGSRLSNAIESYWNYLYDAVWPTGLAPLYPHPYALAPVSNQAAIAAAGLGIALIGLTVLVLMASRKRPYLGVGWLWYLGTLVPMIGLVQVGMQARADRYMYLPLVGLSIVLTWGTGELVTSNRRKLIAPLAGAALIALAIVTRLQLDHWENSITLFERAVTVTERNRYAHERLAYELLQVDRPEEARDHYRAAISIEPWHAPLYYGLAISFEDAGDSDAAIAAYRNALRRQPDMVLANGSLGLLLLQVGHLAEAKRHLLVATRAMPDSIEYKDALAAVVGELERSESGGP